MTSPTWTDLEARFRALLPALQPTKQWLRIDYQWGSAGEHWSLIGSVTNAAKAEFETLCTIAGDLLLALPRTAVAPEALEEANPKHRWYLALWHHMTYKIPDNVGYVDGNPTIFTGLIREPVQLSATLCLQFSTIVLPNLPTSSWGRAQRRIAHEAHERGPFWALIAFLVTVALGLLAL